MAKCEKRKSLPTVLKFSTENCVFYRTEIHGTETVKRCIDLSWICELSLNWVSNNILHSFYQHQTKKTKKKEYKNFLNTTIFFKF